MSAPAKVTVATLRAKKAAGERCVMLTGNDFSEYVETKKMILLK